MNIRQAASSLHTPKSCISLSRPPKSPSQHCSHKQLACTSQQLIQQLITGADQDNPLSFTAPLRASSYRGSAVFSEEAKTNHPSKASARKQHRETTGLATSAAASQLFSNCLITFELAPHHHNTAEIRIGSISNIKLIWPGSANHLDTFKIQPSIRADSSTAGDNRNKAPKISSSIHYQLHSPIGTTGPEERVSKLQTREPSSDRYSSHQKHHGSIQCQHRSFDRILASNFKAVSGFNQPRDPDTKTIPLLVLQQSD
ncbi:hypothetical protein Nepgr_026686 [Nepenthes gracilis]|uniref:Uncharacterized protein n=1 Tax=Nepenthes gracilis TaxID=150966 RepID=A0AAD3T7M0_NEPGR|nr:hypothetical protein Nepgr_026686 [Nepenthes gracilis]